jgi:hypothetical protein
MYTHQLVLCHPCLIWGPVLPLNRTHTLLIPLQLSSMSLAHTNTWLEKFQVCSPLSSMQITPSYIIFCNMMVSYMVRRQPSPVSKLKDNPTSAICHCSLNIEWNPVRMTLLKTFSCLIIQNTLVTKFSHMINIHVSLWISFLLKKKYLHKKNKNCMTY